MKYINKLRAAFSGLFYSLQSDQSFQQQILLGGLVIPLVIYFCSPLKQAELFFLVASFVHILTTELQNSSLEATLNHLHPEQHQAVGLSKDLAASAVLVAGMFFFFVVGSIILTRLI